MVNLTENSNSASAKVKGGDNTPFKVLAVVVIIVVVGLVVAYFTGFFDKNDKIGSSVDTGAVPGNNVIARVNGVVITQNDVNQRAQTIVSGLQTPGTQLSDEQITQAQQIAFQQLVNEILILEAAQQNNISVSNEEIDTEFEKIVTSYPDEQSFQQDLIVNNISEQDVKADIGRQLTIQKYINQNTDSAGIEVTEDEINSAFEQFSSQQEEVAGLEEVREQLVQEIFQAKFNQQIDQLIQTLQAAASIEILN